MGDSNNLYSQYCIYQSKPSAMGVAAIKLDEAPFEAKAEVKNFFSDAAVLVLVIYNWPVCHIVAWINAKGRCSCYFILQKGMI